MTNSQDVNDIVDIGKSDIFSFDALQHYHEFLNVTGNSFHVTLKTPKDGLQVDRDFTKNVSFDWYSLAQWKTFHKYNKYWRLWAACNWKITSRDKSIDIHISSYCYIFRSSYNWN